VALWQDPLVVNSEMLWLSYLQAGSGIRVQEPIQTQQGKLFAWYEDNHGLRAPCVLLRWIEGNCGGLRLNSEEAQKSAVLLARLHDVSTKWTPPLDFVRPKFDEEYLKCAAREAQAHSVIGRVSAEDLNVIVSCVEEIRALLSILGERADQWGLIHGDYTPANLVFADGEPVPIDFSECGFGYYLMDVGACLLHLGNEGDLFLETYERLRPLPPDGRRIVQALAIVRIIYWLAFTASLPERHDKVAAIVKNFCVPRCQRFLEGGSFFGDDQA
jgi:Ser/Thr protein kinase RdoA (MazF antagonist)